MKIFDCFMFYDEDLLLDLRLNILDQHVDFFVIVESKYFHNGNERQLKFDIRKYKKFENKICKFTKSAYAIACINGTSALHIALKLSNVEKNDEVFFISKKGEASKVVNEMRKKEEPYKNIIIAGGGKIGARLAKRIENNHRVKIIESSNKRAKRLSEKLESSIVLEGDVCDKNLLYDENVENTDVVAAVTNDDEANVMSCLLAKEMGAHKTVALINNPAYVDLVQTKGIDIAVAPSQITIGTFHNLICIGVLYALL